MSLIALTDERLYNQAVKVDNAKSLSIKLLRDKMIKIMKSKKGIGLAANQIGRSEAVFIMYKNGLIITCINPTILWESEEKIEIVEGCLSIPSKELKVKRASKIIAQYTDLRGELKVEKLSGIEAICYQHELDHLNGLTIIHRNNEQI